MRSTILIFFVMFGPVAFAQGGLTTPTKRFVNLSVGRSMHGTGDMKGISQRVMYGAYFKKRLFWFTSIGADLHDGEFGVRTMQPDGEVVDHSLRYTTGAMQLTGGAGISFVRTEKTELGLRAAAAFRYQSSSLPDGLNTVFDPDRIGPYPAMFIENISPQRTFSVGVIPEIFFQQTIFNGFTLGCSAGIQFDTRGDVLKSLALSIGKRF